MQGMVDMKTLIHAGIEVMAFGGLIYMFNKRVAALNERIQTLEQEQKMKEVINRLGSVVFGMPPPGGHPPQESRPGVQQNPVPQAPSPPPKPDLTDNDLDALLGDELKDITGSVNAGDIQVNSEPLKKK